MKDKVSVSDTRSRRDGVTLMFAGASLMAAALSIMAAYNLQNYHPKQKQPFRVIIIGGGISGLSAAYTLTSGNSNVEVTLLEAKDRLGGRLHTIHMPMNDETSSSSPIDMGGMYWHGSDSPAMRFLQSLSPTVPSGGKSNLPGHGHSEWRMFTPAATGDHHDEHDAFDSKGTWKTLTANDLERAQDLYLDWDRHLKQQYALHAHGAYDENDAYACYAQAGPSNDQDGESTGSCSLNGDSESLLEQWSSSFLSKLSTEDRLMVEFIKTMSFQLDRGVPLEQLSLHGLPDDWGWRDIGGTDHVAKYGMSHVVDALASKIDMNLRLRERVTRIDYSRPHSCIVTTEQNRSYTADACIVTLPIGVLKAKAHALFHPPLPFAKQDALRRAGVGLFNTLAVHWSVPLCGSGSTASYLVGHLQIDNPLRFGFICSAQLRDPQDSNSITQFYISGSDHPFHDMAYWKEQALQIVRTMRSDVKLTDILDAYISSWHLDEDILGSYSVATLLTNGNADRSILAESLGQVVHFAGEHTHTGGRYQSIDGAFETGERAAAHVMNQATAHG
ncbi:hypothetical protein MPSEU_000686200 [Mayamaea pseudoterrestris]|nr:hypothetical protein MPSEU_000686200 [Mayamaea pseudoterrestris]